MMTVSTRYVLTSIFLFGCLQTEGKHVRLLCGSNLQYYNPENEECNNGQVSRRTTTPASNQRSTSSNAEEETEHISVSEQNQSRRARRTCRGNADLLICNGNLYCGRHEGYKCCGFEVYHPQSQTCCRQTSAEYKIHNDTPEERHICCNLDVYDRDSPNVTCKHAAANDKFFKPPNRLKKSKRICEESDYVIRINIKKRQYLTADVRVWPWHLTEASGKLRMKKSATIRKEMEIKLDKYSKKKNITKKSYLIFSNYNYIKDAVLFLRPNEVLYKCPMNHKGMVRKLRKIQKRCKS